MIGIKGVAEGRSHNQPCAACRMLRRRCDSKCLLAPYFPPDEIYKFAGVHRVFGASNVIKMIQMVEETKREDAVKAIVYEAKARLRDPVHGSAGTILLLQKMVQELKVDLESVRARVSELQEQRDQLLTIHHTKVHNNFDHVFPINDPKFVADYHSILAEDDVDHIMAYDPLEFPLEMSGPYNSNNVV